MPRPNLPAPKDVIEIAKGMKAEGIVTGNIRCSDGTEITWGENSKVDGPSALDKWRAEQNAS